MQLAQGYPGLEELKIGIDSWSDTNPSATGITDSFIRELALHLSNLKCLYLVFESDTRHKPGCIQSIQTPGRRCKQLEELVLSCRSDWPLVASVPRREEIPLAFSLEGLQLLPDNHTRHCLTEEDKIEESVTHYIPVSLESCKDTKTSTKYIIVAAV